MIRRYSNKLNSDSKKALKMRARDMYIATLIYRLVYAFNRSSSRFNIPERASKELYMDCEEALEQLGNQLSVDGESLKRDCRKEAYDKFAQIFENADKFSDYVVEDVNFQIKNQIPSGYEKMFSDNI